MVVSVARRVALTAAMPGPANVLALLSVPIPISPFQTRLHLIQLPATLAGLLAGPWVGAVAGLLGAFLTSYQVGIPFIVGGSAILGGLVGYLSFKGFRPLSASIVALAIELPYVAVRDLLYLQWPVVQIVLVMLAVETLIFACLAVFIVRSTAVESCVWTVLLSARFSVLLPKKPGRVRSGGDFFIDSCMGFGFDGGPGGVRNSSVAGLGFRIQMRSNLTGFGLVPTMFVLDQ